MRPADVDDILPLLPAQSGMLFHVLENPEITGRYVAVLSCHIEGPLDPDRLSQVMQEAISDRDAYRAAFVWEGVKQPVQVIKSEVTLPWEMLDWSLKPEQEVDTTLGDLILLEQSRQFDLAQAPLMAVKLIRRSATHHILVWTIHHLISDGWSTSVVFRDVFRRYLSEPAPQQKPASLRDVLVWSRKGGRAEIDDAYWADHLKGLEEPSQLDFAPVDAARRGHGHIQLEIGEDLTKQLLDMARACRVTPNTVLSAAWALMLRHLMSRDDVVFGQTSAGRPPEIPGIAEAAGAFINTLPLRLSLDAHEDTEAFLTRLQALQQTHARHDHVPLAKVQALAPLPQGTALFNTLFVNEGVAETQHQFGAIKLRDLKTIQSSNYTLAMLVTPRAAIGCELYFDRTKLSGATAQQILERYAAVVRALVSNRSGTIQDVMQNALPAMRVPTSQQYPLVLDRFLEQVDQNPDAPAVSDGETTLTYRQLLDRASGIASMLARAGVASDEIVPVALDRGAESLAAFLGVWMVGAAYVPLDMTYPEERLRQIVEIVKPRRVLSSERMAEKLPPHAADTLLIETAPRTAEFSPRPGKLAYVIFTSGSQGQPKGVLISQDALARSTGARDEVYGETPDAYLMVSSLAFDSSVPGLYWPLATGGHVVISPFRAEQSPEQLGALIARHRVSHILCLPSLARALLTTIAPSDLAHLKTIIPAGEALTAEVCDTVSRTLPGVRVVNEYGPTEATVWATAYDATKHSEGPVPIGKPVPGLSVAVCDKDGIPKPTGVIGEILIAGPTLAEGYLNASDQTAASFQERPGELGRVYKTGDLGRVDDAGDITFIGRADRQIKVRGHRVELGEVEAAAQDVLGSTPSVAMAVSGAVCLCIEGHGDDGRSDHLRTSLADRLPAPFLPAKIHWMEMFPRLPNGKIDQTALSLQIGLLNDGAPIHQTPTTDLETQISEIFSEVFGQDHVPPDGNFFDLGGDSLMTLKAYALAKKRGLGFAPTDIFEHPTVRSLAQYVIRQSQKPVVHEGVRNVCFTHTDGEKDVVFLVHGTMQLFHQLARGLGNRHPTGVLFSHYLFGLNVKLNVRVEDLADEAIADMRALRPSGPYILCAYSAGAPIALEMARKLGDEVSQLFLIDPPYRIMGADPELTATPDARRHQKEVRLALALRVVRHAIRVAALTALAPVMSGSEWRRKKLVRSAYVFALSRYRMHRHDGPAHVFITKGNPALDPGSAMDTHLPHKTVEVLDLTHNDVTSKPEGVMAVTTRIVRWIKEK